ncbi:VUT family protein [Dietzia sp. CQ4]|nr:VUT family protein [Dietzia sp. CQ4]
MYLFFSIVAYVTAVVLANIVTDRYGLVTVGFGLLVTAGTYAAGFAPLARDYVHRYGGRTWAIVAVAVGGIISWFTASPALAIASTVAFIGAELIDLLVYVPIRRARGFVLGALASNVVSAPIDTVVLLYLAGFSITVGTMGGQFIGKVLWATMVPLALYWLLVHNRRRRRLLVLSLKAFPSSFRPSTDTHQSRNSSLSATGIGSHS